MCNSTHRMDDLIGTNDAAKRLGVSVATLNRWAAENRLPVAVALPGKRGARLFRTADVDAYGALRALRKTKAIEHEACPACTTGGVQTWHSGPCPNAEQVAS